MRHICIPPHYRATALRMGTAGSDSTHSKEAVKASSDNKVEPLHELNHDTEKNTTGTKQIDIRDKIDAGLDAAQLKRTIRKVDWRLVPILAALYSINSIDRGNLALARAAGMNRTLELSVGNRYSIMVMAFFVS